MANHISQFKKSTFTFSLLILLGLSGCANMNSNFDCPNKAGVSCKSMDSINTMVDSGQLNSSDASQNNSSSNSNNNDDNDFETYQVQNTTYYPGAPIRYGETVVRVWVAPFEDDKNNYHDASVIYSVVKGGHWIGAPFVAKNII